MSRGKSHADRTQKKRNTEGESTVFPRKAPQTAGLTWKRENGENPAAGSIAFVPSVAGMLIAGEVVRDLLADNPRTQIFQKKEV